MLPPEESWVAGDDPHFCGIEHHRENLCFYNLLVCLRWLKILSLAYKKLKQSLMVDLQKISLFFSSHFLKEQVVELRGMLPLVSVPGRGLRSRAEAMEPLFWFVFGFLLNLHMKANTFQPAINFIFEKQSNY